MQTQQTNAVFKLGPLNSLYEIRMCPVLGRGRDEEPPLLLCHCPNALR